MPHAAPRILALDPGTRYMGVAVIEPPELIYFGVKEFKTKRPIGQLVRATRHELLDLIRLFEPVILAYERSYFVQSRESVLLQAQEAAIANLGQELGLEVASYSPRDVRAVVCRDEWATKEMVADVMVRRFPELQRHHDLPHGWQQRYWLHMFDAVAVGVACADAKQGEEEDPQPELVAA